jgi:predicted DNA repair protein MutK
MMTSTGSAMRFGLGAAVAAALLAAGGVAAAKAVDNKMNDYLLKLPEEQRAAWLARTVGEWCIGTHPFPMGVAQTGAAAGNAYWSFTCAGAGSFVVQLDMLGHGVAIDCESFKAEGQGKACFKKF